MLPWHITGALLPPCSSSECLPLAHPSPCPCGKPHALDTRLGSVAVAVGDSPSPEHPPLTVRVGMMGEAKHQEITELHYCGVKVWKAGRR